MQITKPSHLKRQYSNLANFYLNCLPLYICKKTLGLKLGYSGLIQRLTQTLIRKTLRYSENILFISNYFSDFFPKSLSKL